MNTPLSDEMMALLNYANETTEGADSNLGDAVKTLCDGYMQGGGGEDPLPPKTVDVTYFINAVGSQSIAYNMSGISSMEVDGGSAVSPASTYNFTTTGLHTIRFHLANNYINPQYPTVALGGFYNIKTIIKARVSEDITQFNQWFRGCTNLTSINLKHVTHFANACFSDCTSLVGVLTLKDAVSINMQSFSNTGLVAVYLPNIEHLGGNSSGNGVFANNSKLTFALLGPSFSSYDTHVFHNDTALKTVVILATTPPTCTASTGKLFGYQFTGDSIYVPDASVDAYKADANFADYVAKIKPLSEYNLGPIPE